MPVGTEYPDPDEGAFTTPNQARRARLQRERDQDATGQDEENFAEA